MSGGKFGNPKFDCNPEFSEPGQQRAGLPPTTAMWSLIVYMGIGPHELFYNTEEEARAAYERARKRAAFARFQMEVKPVNRGYS